MGLLLTSTLAAHDLGYLTLGEMASRLEKTFHTFGRLQRFHGHFLNWYDTRTLEPLPPGSYYHHQLRGLRVEDPSGRHLGKVEDLMDLGAGAPVLVVRGARGETLIPLAEEFVRSIDLARGLMVALEPEPVDA